MNRSKHAALLDTVNPLIIVGMHRSGTSLLARLLNDLGIHMGAWLSRDAEAVFFQKINRRIYSHVNAHWAEPENILSAMQSQEFIQKQSSEIREKFSGTSPVTGRYFRKLDWQERIQKPDFFWGWKDPRTALVIPIWYQVFPQARWVHIIRNGIDVATSLYLRAFRQQNKWIRKFYRFDFSDRTLDFEYCFRLWEIYLNSISKAFTEINPNLILQIHYEDLLQEPEDNLSKILEFLQYESSPKEIKRVCTQIDRSKIHNSKSRDKHKKLITELPSSNWMRELGYSDRGVD